MYDTDLSISDHATNCFEELFTSQSNDVVNVSDIPIRTLGDEDIDMLQRHYITTHTQYITTTITGGSGSSAKAVFRTGVTMHARNFLAEELGQFWTFNKSPYLGFLNRVKGFGR